MTQERSSLERAIGRLEGHLDRLEILFERLERHGALFDQRLRRVERTHAQWRAWVAVILGVVSFVGSLLPYALKT